ncbi:MAG: NAD-dependent epimerase/dehydratase family protein [Thermoguttaceae bacterium]
MARVLVTGGNGFIGCHLAKALQAQGDDVTCLVRRSSSAESLRPLGVTIAYGDVLDRESLKTAVAGKSSVYHVAGCIMTAERRVFYDVNEEGTRNVAAVCAEQTSPPVLVFTSSLSAGGPAPEGRPRTEEDPPAPVSDYGRSKLAGERAAREYADRVPITVVRPPIVLGEGDTKGLELFRSIDRYRCHLVPGIAPRRFSIIHVADLVRGIILAAQRGKRLVPADRQNGDSPGTGCYFLSGPEQPTYGELGRMARVELHRAHALVVPVPMPIVRLIAMNIEMAGRIRGQAFYFNIDRFREVAAGSWTCSSRRAKEEIGFTVGAPLPQRLRQIVEWYRQVGWL